MIAVNRHIGITRIDTQLHLVIVGIVQGLGEQIAVDKIDALAVLMQPAKEFLNQWLAVRLPVFIIENQPSMTTQKFRYGYTRDFPVAAEA